MKKILLSLLMVSSLAYASYDCKSLAHQVNDKLHKDHRNSIEITYSQDKEHKATICKDAITSLNGSIKVVTNRVDGSNIFKFGPTGEGKKNSNASKTPA